MGCLIESDGASAANAGCVLPTKVESASEQFANKKITAKSSFRGISISFPQTPGDRIESQSPLFFRNSLRLRSAKNEDIVRDGGTHRMDLFSLFAKFGNTITRMRSSVRKHLNCSANAEIQRQFDAEIAAMVRDTTAVESIFNGVKDHMVAHLAKIIASEHVDRISKEMSALIDEAFRRDKNPYVLCALWKYVLSGQ
ncbi:MAG: hypothetical protein LBT64_00225 [Puniceicoccales bacterium]|jgi:hypothetical protein|nr:hypothetical protein [Puniceicoccales bacterium]